MELAGTFKCERRRCPRSKGDCGECGRPEVKRDVIAVLELWKRCKDWNVLPRGGGVFDQDEKVMEVLDIVSAEVNKWQAKRALDSRIEMDQEETLRRMPGVRNRR